MQLRSGHRLVSPPVPAPTEGVRRARPRRSPDGAHADGEDRLSGLPEELRLEVLVRLGCALEAARTSVLSSRWRGLWTDLRDLTFERVGPDSLDAALTQVRPKLNRLRIRDYKSGRCAAARISSLLRAADRLAPSELVVGLHQDYSGSPFEMPCFERATSIALFIDGLNFTLPPAGHFASLEQLSLCNGLLNPSVFLHRCPRLRKLDMDSNCPREVKTLTVESKSLEELTWQSYQNCPLAAVNIVAPELKKFRLTFVVGDFIVSLSAPKLEEFHLGYGSGCCGIRSGNTWRLRHLELKGWCNRHEQGQLPRVHELVLSLLIDGRKRSSLAERSFEQEVARLPVTEFSVLELSISMTEGHVFGALLLELLRIRTTIQRLVLTLILMQECSENCDCDQASSWRNEQISLPDLKVVEIEGFHGADHEVDFLKLLFRSAPMLKRMTIKLSALVPPNNRGCQELCSILEANASMKCDVYDRCGEKISFS